jgi:hypothetical protein
MGKSRKNKGDQTKKKTTAKAKDTVPECAVCLDPLLKTDAVKTLPCRHIFHRACVQKILNTPGLADVCPLCRANIETGDQQPPLEAGGGGGMAEQILRQHARHTEVPRGRGRERRPLLRQSDAWRSGEEEAAAATAEAAVSLWDAPPGFLGAAEATGPFGHPSGAPPHPHQFGPGGGGMTRDQREEAEARELQALVDSETARDYATSSTGTAPAAAAEGSDSDAGNAIAALTLAGIGTAAAVQAYPYAARAAENCTICGGRRTRRGRTRRGRTKRGKTRRRKTRRRKTRTGRTIRKHRRT